MDAENVLLRRDGESELEYHKRLVYGKLVDKTLADYDYAELAPYVYGKDYSADVTRRLLYGSRYTLDLIENNLINDLSEQGEDAIIAKIETKKAELQREQQRFYDQRREYNKLLTQDSRYEHLRDVIARAAERVGEEIGIMYDVSTCYLDDEPGEKHNEAVLVFADWHYGMTTNNVFNKYDITICKERVANVVASAIERLQLHRCETLHVVVLGDLSHGAIHTTARVAADELAVDQIIHSSEILAQAIHEVSKYVEHTFVYMTYGNHTRTVQNKKDNVHSDNMERLVNWWLIERFKNDDGISVAPVPDNEFILFDVGGHTFCASHGDLDTVQKSPKLLSTLFQKKYGIDIEYILLGDKHHRESYNELGITSMICGSLCGTDDYANGKRLYSEPSQLLLIVNEDYGVDAEYQIKC